LFDTYVAPVDEFFLSFHLSVLCVFTALHGMQTRSSDENSVCLSVCPSEKRVNCDKTIQHLRHEIDSCQTVWKHELIMLVEDWREYIYIPTYTESVCYRKRVWNQMKRDSSNDTWRVKYKQLTYQYRTADKNCNR